MQDNLSLTFSALADPTRRAMIAHLAKGDANVSDLAKPFLKHMSLPAITKHLKVLEKAELVTKTRDAQWRLCKLNSEPLKDVSDWMEHYRVFWEESFDRLDAYLKTVTAKKNIKKGRKMVARNKPNELYITRIYDAPVKTVWDAWTDPKKAAKWWGPRGFTITTISKDVRTGGSWIYTMHGPDGTDWPNTTQYLEVEKYSRLVYDHGGSEDRPPLFRVTVEFTEVKGKTKMEMTMALPTPEAAKETKKFIKLAGGDSTWDRLSEYLEKESTGNEQFVINRTFETSIEVMFDMWTNPEHFSKWLPPTGMIMKFHKADIKTGGSTLYSMTDGGSFTMYGCAKYLEITKPNRIVYTQQFCDENGNIIHAPFAPTWPMTMLLTITLAEEGPNQTRVTAVTTIIDNPTAEEMKTFIDERAGMTQGWTGSFDKLENLLNQK